MAMENVMGKPVIDFSAPQIAAELIKTIIDNTPVAYSILDTDLRVHYVNDYYLKLRNRTREQVLGNYCYNFTNEGKPCRTCAVKKSIRSGERELIHRKDILPDGTYLHLDDYAIPLADEDGRFDYVLEVMVNRTDEMVIREKNKGIFLGLIESLTAMLDKKDRYTSNHSRDVTEIAQKLGRYIGLRETELTELRLASLLHDIGKIFIPDEIINKQGTLSDEEFNIIKRHPEETSNMLKDLTLFGTIQDIAGAHHERWDGNGYPNGLEGETIPLGARILAIADTYDAMTSTRSYRNALSHDQAVEEIQAKMGTQFDPELAMLFVCMTENHYPDRGSLIGNDKTKVLPKMRDTRSVERRMTQITRNTTRLVNNRHITQLMSQNGFHKAIMQHSPCHYLILDHGYHILFASDSIVSITGMDMEEILSRRCHELNGRQTDCFEMTGGVVRCPVVRTRVTGKHQTSAVNILDQSSGQVLCCEVYAIPVQLSDINNEKHQCIMEIFLDRTDETIEYEAIQHDIKVLLELLFRLVANINPETTRGTEAIINECASFSEYLSGMDTKMRGMLGSDDERSNTVYLELSI